MDVLSVLVMFLCITLIGWFFIGVTVDNHDFQSPEHLPGIVMGMSIHAFTYCLIFRCNAIVLLPIFTTWLGFVILILKRRAPARSMFSARNTVLILLYFGCALAGWLTHNITLTNALNASVLVLCFYDQIKRAHQEPEMLQSLPWSVWAFSLSLQIANMVLNDLAFGLVVPMLSLASQVTLIGLSGSVSYLCSRGRKYRRRERARLSGTIQR